MKDYEPLGMLTTVADRLADDCSPGEIRVGGGVYRLCFQCGKCDVVCPWNRVTAFSIRKIVWQAALGLPEIELDEICQVWVAAGTYRPTVGSDRVGSFQPKNGVGVYGGFQGDETDRTQRDWKAHPTVLEATDGNEAVEAVRAKAYDLVLMDLQMPGLDGIEVLKIIKERSPETECVMVTANESIPLVIKAVRAGAYDYLRSKWGDVVLGIDIDEDYVKRHQEAGRNVVHGDATDMSVLASEGVGDARTFVALTGNDETNLMACLLAQELGAQGHEDDEADGPARGLQHGHLEDLAQQAAFADSDPPAQHEAQGGGQGHDPEAPQLDQDEDHRLAEGRETGPGIADDQAGHAGRRGGGEQGV